MKKIIKNREGGKKREKNVEKIKEDKKKLHYFNLLKSKLKYCKWAHPNAHAPVLTRILIILDQIRVFWYLFLMVS